MKLRQLLKECGLLIALIMASHLTTAQDVIEHNAAEKGFSQRVWYKNYVSVKLHPKWSVDNALMLGLRDMKHTFSFAQIGVGGTYRFNKFWSTRLGYESTFFRHSNWWRENYDLLPGVLNSVHFQSVSLSLRRRDNVGNFFRVKQTVEGKFFTPRYQKFQTRLRYGVHFAYRKSNLPLRIRPFVSTSLYYYLGGEPVVFGPSENIEMELEMEAGQNIEEHLIDSEIQEVIPNGFHRLFSRVGMNFKPLKAKLAPSVTIYYAYNREFNLLGNPINVPLFGNDGQLEDIQLPFNNYGVFGAQLNWYF